MDNKKKLLKAISSLEMLKTDKEIFVDTIIDIANNSSGGNSNSLFQYRYYKMDNRIIDLLNEFLNLGIKGEIGGLYMQNVVIKASDYDGNIILWEMAIIQSGPGGDYYGIAIPKYFKTVIGVIDFYELIPIYCNKYEEDYNEIYNVFKGNEITEEEFNKDISILTADEFE